jgi:hypothetical protein
MVKVKMRDNHHVNPFGYRALQWGMAMAQMADPAA